MIIGSEANAPTISNSGLFGLKPNELAGNTSSESIDLPEPVAYAIESLA